MPELTDDDAALAVALLMRARSDGRPLYRRELASGDVIEVWWMIYSNRITLATKANDGICFESGYCYKDRARALVEAAAWDGEGDPKGWNKNTVTGEWRD